MESVAILGAGIGGLTLAASLEKAGIEFEVFERTSMLGEVGAGLGLWSNATRALEEIGIDSGFWNKHGCEVHTAEVAAPDGKVLSGCDIRSLVAELGSGAYVVHRADLHSRLASSFSSERIKVGMEFRDLDQDQSGVTLRFMNGSERKFGLAIGADGLHSKVRASLFGRSAPRYSGQTCYRGIAKLKLQERHVLREIQGAGIRAAVIPLNDERVYWWATEKNREGEEDDPLSRRDHLLQLFGDWSFNVPEALANTDSSAILRNDLYDREPIDHWSEGRVALMGDAAHPTTPNLGQGACLAIEDAIYLGKKLAQNGVADFSRNFGDYERDRMTRCYRIVKQSRRFGWIGSWENMLAVKMREVLISATPDFVMQNNLRSHLSYPIAG